MSFFINELSIDLGLEKIAGNGQVLLQVGYFITSSPEPLPN
jgi:hypothetical protein